MTTSKASKGVNEVTTTNEHNGGRCLNELAIIADDIDKMIAAPANRPADKSQSATVPVAPPSVPGALGPFDELRHFGPGVERHNGYNQGFRDGWNTCRERVLAASPAAAAVDVSLHSTLVPEGWMRDKVKVVELAEHLEAIGWRPDSYGDPECYDQGAAMAADVIRKVLLPLIAAAPASEASP